MTPVHYFGSIVFNNLGICFSLNPKSNEYMRFVQLVSSNQNPQNARLGHSREARFRYRVYGLTGVTSR